MYLLEKIKIGQFQKLKNQVVSTVQNFSLNILINILKLHYILEYF